MGCINQHSLIDRYSVASKHALGNVYVAGSLMARVNIVSVLILQYKGVQLVITLF